MRIAGLQIDRFGIWSGVQFENLSEGVNVFYGPNEAGKTTLLQFIRMVLYGFGDGRSERYLIGSGVRHGMLSAGARVGGSLALVTEEDEYHVRRYTSQTQPTEDLVGEVRLTSRDGIRQGSHRLGRLLSGIDETIFNNVYAVGLREMQYLGTLNDTQASRYLYNLSTGTDRVSLVDVMRQLQKTRQRLIGAAGGDSVLGELLDRRQRQLAIVGQLSSQVDQWAHCRAELEGLDEEVSRLEASRTGHARKSRVLQLAERAAPFWKKKRELETEIAVLGNVPHVCPESIEQIAQLQVEIESRATRVDELSRQQASQKGRDIRDEDAVVRNLLRIEALLEHRNSIAALEDQLQQFETRRDEGEFEIHAELERLGLRSDPEKPIRVDEQVFAALREPARALEAERERLEEAKSHSSQLKTDAERIGKELGEALGRDPDWLDDRASAVSAVEHTDTIAQDLRRRIEVDAALDSVQHKLADVERRRSALVVSQLLPQEVVIALGALFAAGAICLMIALFGEHLQLSRVARMGFMVLGAAGSLIAVALKVVIQGSSRQDWEECRQRLAATKKKHQGLQREADELDRRIPGRRTGPFSIASAQQRLTRLESLMPLEKKRRSMLDAAEKYQHRAVQIARRMKALQQTWSESLESLGLSTKLTPSQIRQLAGETGTLGQLNRDQHRVDIELEETARELGVYRTRIADLLADIGLKPTSKKATDQLAQLSATVTNHEKRRKEMEQDRIDRQQARDRHQGLLRELRHLESQRLALIAAQGAVDEQDLARLCERRDRWDELQAAIANVDNELDAITSSDDEKKSVLAELLMDTNKSLDDRIAANQEEIDRCEKRLKELLLRRGELAEKRRGLGADRQLSEALLEVGQIDTHIDKAAEQVQVISAITNMLRSVYKRYEKDRQPETLQQASEHLRRMTGQKYQRIWTPLDEDILYVDDHQGKSMPVDQLSRGTREQLFLALRLALVAGYARRGVRIPLVLDDVLVNFDVIRTQAAAEVLIDFADAGHQVLIFTCHEHVVEIFGDLGVDVRRLPGRPAKEPEASVVRELPEPEKIEPAVVDFEPVTARVPTQFMIGYDDGWAVGDDEFVGVDVPPILEPVSAVVETPAVEEFIEEPATIHAHEQRHEWREPVATDREADTMLGADEHWVDRPLEYRMPVAAASAPAEPTGLGIGTDVGTSREPDLPSRFAANVGDPWVSDSDDDDDEQGPALVDVDEPISTDEFADDDPAVERLLTESEELVEAGAEIVRDLDQSLEEPPETFESLEELQPATQIEAAVESEDAIAIEDTVVTGDVPRAKNEALSPLSPADEEVEQADDEDAEYEYEYEYEDETDEGDDELEAQLEADAEDDADDEDDVEYEYEYEYTDEEEEES